jgi:DUF1365 family protein
MAVRTRSLTSGGISGLVNILFVTSPGIVVRITNRRIWKMIKVIRIWAKRVRIYLPILPYLPSTDLLKIMGTVRLGAAPLSASPPHTHRFPTVH